VCAPTGVVQTNSTVNGALSTSNCTLPDGTAYADYLLVFPVHGAWTGAVTAADGVTPLTLILRDLSGAQIYSGANIQGAVERGTYHLLVNGSAVGYQLASSFTPAPNVLCWSFPLMGTIRTINGLLGLASCQLPDGSPYDGYQLTLYGSGTVDIAVNAYGFTPLVILRSSDGYSLPGNISTDAYGATHLTIEAVGNDTYTLCVAVSSPDQIGGAYSVSATFTPDDGEACVSQSALTTSQKVNGAISPTGCNFNLPGRDDNAFFTFYNVHLDQTGVVQASIPASDFSPLLLLLDADGNTISEDIESGGNGTPLIEQQVAPGDYVLVVFNEDSFGGNYTLNYQYTAGPGPACPVVSMNPGDQVAGTLTGGVSCADFGYMADTYQLVLPADGSLSLLLSSPDFSTFVDLRDAKDNELTWGAQSSDGSGSFLNVNLPADTYFAHAASMDLPGGYTLSYTFTPMTLPACPAAMPMPPNGYIQNAQLGASSCQGKDGRFADYYAFTLPAASTQALFMLSTAVSPYVTLYQPDGTPLRSDQNSYADNSAVIVQYLAAGNYQVKARSADPNATGLYSLYLNYQAGPPQLCAPRSLAVNITVTGQTSFTSCAWYDKTFADVYALNIVDSSLELAIGAQSTAFDAFLILCDAKGNVLAADDNSGGGSNPMITQALDPGTYFVVVKPSSDPTSAGSYTLTATATPAGTSNLKRKKKVKILDY
jgi:hypothetical protein